MIKPHWLVFLSRDPLKSATRLITKRAGLLREITNIQDMKDLACRLMREMNLS